MKKVINVLIILAIVATTLCMHSNVNAQVSILDKIVENFNNSELANVDPEDSNYSFRAYKKENGIDVEIIEENEKRIKHFPFNGNILKIEILPESVKGNKDVLIEDWFDKLEKTLYKIENVTVVSYLLDSIGKLQGYSKGELTKTITDERAIEKYTLENEGVKIEKYENDKFIAYIDITKRIPLLDFKNIYFQEADLEKYADALQSNGKTLIHSKGNIYFEKDEDNGIIKLFLREDGGLTENAYKSLISILKVTLNNQDEVEYFKTNYNSFDIGNKSFDGVDIKFNQEKTAIGFDLKQNNNKETVMITVNRKLINAKVQKNEFVEYKEIKEYEIRDTGKNYNIFIIIVFVLILIGAGVALVLLIKDNKNENL